MNILVAMPAEPVRATFLTEEVLAVLGKLGTIQWNSSPEQFTNDEFRTYLRDVDVCITGWGCPRLDQSILRDAEKLCLVMHTGGTVAPIASDFLYEKGIKVISGNKIYAESVAEGVIAYMLTALRDIPYYAAEMQAGRWRSDTFYNEGLFEQTVGLIGFGMVGQTVARMLKPFRAKIKVFSDPIDKAVLNEYGAEAASLEEIFTTCKIISLHLPQKPETYHMINSKLLRMIPDGALLVNTARGGIVDEEALAEELEKNRFKAILDVFETEPLPADSKLRRLRNVILIPHMAGPTIDRRKFVALGLLADIERFFKGEELKYEISRDYAMNMTR